MLCADMRQRRIAGSVFTTSAGSHYSRMHPASVSAKPSRRSASRNSTSPPSDEISPPAKSAVTFLRLTAGIWTGRRVSSVMVAWRFRCLGRRAFHTHFLPNLKELRHVCHHNIGPR